MIALCLAVAGCSGKAGGTESDGSTDPDADTGADGTTDPTGDEITDADAEPGDRWRVLPIRSEEEWEAGRTGGEAEQHPHSIARSLSDPARIYLSHDVGGCWRSGDSGDTWQKCLDVGLWVNKGQSIEVDPEDPLTVFFVVDNSYDWLAEGWEGLYRSEDAGDSWELVLQADTGYDSSLHRIYRHNVAFDPTSVTGAGAQRWYVAFAAGGLHRSEDGGDSWGSGPVSSLASHPVVYAVRAHPSDGQTVYVATSEGLLASNSRGAGLAPIGDLPSGDVSSLEIDPGDPRTMYATVLGDGLYRSEDGGSTFSLVRDFDAARVFMNPGHPDVLYLVGVGENTIITHDAGDTWIEDMVTHPFPGLGREGSWKSRIAGQLSGIVPDPGDPDEAVAFSRATIWKTTDGGHSFHDSSTLFTGYAWSWWNGGAAFDRTDVDRFAFFNCDVGMVITHAGGDWFDRRNDQAWDWYSAGDISWIGAYAGDFHPTDTGVMVASVGGYFSTKLMTTSDEGRTWLLVEGQDDERNLFIAFHPGDPDIVYAGNKISTNGGSSFSLVDFGDFGPDDPEILGMCEADPDTVYAMDDARNAILRSDDRAASWREYVRPGWRFRVLDSLPTFAADPADCNMVWTIDADGDLASFDGTTWTSTGVLGLAGGGDIGNFVRTAAVDPVDASVVYAGMFSSGIPCVFRSLDGGSSWEDITHNLPRTGMSAMAVNPHTRELFKGSAVGTWIFPPP